jgi:branched-chain amino acid transport system ATP-binding protein
VSAAGERGAGSVAGPAVAQGDLICEGVTKRFGGVQVLTDVSLAAAAGAITGLIGPNGAGKSTLFAVVAGFQAADAGEVRLAGRSLAGLSPVQRARSGLGRTFQIPREFKHMSVRENLRVAAPGQSGERLLSVFLRPGRVAREERELDDRVAQLVAFLNLGSVADRPAGMLSGGQKKLLELGRLLMRRPRFVLLDEPFAGVNPVLIDELSERIRVLNREGLAFFIVEHNLPALSRLASVLHVLDRGSLIASGTPDAVLADPAVRAAYLGYRGEEAA